MEYLKKIKIKWELSNLWTIMSSWGKIIVILISGTPDLKMWEKVQNYMF